MKTASTPLGCYDCGEPYGSEAWIEAVVPHKVWKKHISPNGNSAGILCIKCMAKRAVSAGLADVPVALTCGPFVAVQNPNDCDINALCEQLSAATRKPSLNKADRLAIRRAITVLHFAAPRMQPA